jgi:hypothetical protein
LDSIPERYKAALPVDNIAKPVAVRVALEHLGKVVAGAKAGSDDEEDSLGDREQGEKREAQAMDKPDFVADISNITVRKKRDPGHQALDGHRRRRPGNSLSSMSEAEDDTRGCSDPESSIDTVRLGNRQLSIGMCFKPLTTFATSEDCNETVSKESTVGFISSRTTH